MKNLNHVILAAISGKASSGLLKKQNQLIGSDVMKTTSRSKAASLRNSGLSFCCESMFYNDYSFENAAVLGQAADNGIRLTYLKEERADINFNVTLSEHCASQSLAKD